MSGSRQYVVVTDIDMSFGNMVWFMVKWAFASIPAMIIIAIIVAVLVAVFGGFLVGMGAAYGG
jgi:ABC-type sugar transport system permease subunit